MAEEKPEAQETPKAEEETQGSSQETLITTAEEPKEPEVGNKESLLVGKEEGETETEKTKEEVLDEEVKYDLKLPEESVVSEDALKEVEEFAKENKLSNEAAQKLVDREDAAVKAWSEKQVEAFQSAREQWIEKARNHKEFGRDRFEESQSLARKLLSDFGTKEFAEALTTTGWGDNDLLFDFICRIAYARKDDDIAKAAAAKSAEPVPMAHKFYRENSPELIRE